MSRWSLQIRRVVGVEEFAVDGYTEFKLDEDICQGDKICLVASNSWYYATWLMFEDEIYRVASEVDGSMVTERERDGALVKDVRKLFNEMMGMLDLL